jgi:hypothetical protein
LYQQFGFICNCEACEKNFPLAKNLRKIDEDFKEPLMNSTISEVIEENWKYIDRNIKQFPCYELVKLMHVNKKLVHKLLLGP